MKKAFTLAEILITLSIIGVIACMTIPSLVQDVQDAQYKTAWKKSYADLDGAIKRILLENAGSLKKLCTGDECFRGKILKYVNYIKDCPSGASEGICWTTWGSDRGAFILNNGSFVKTEWGSQTCDITTWHGTLPKCGMIWVDVNGLKGPNMFGRDMFAAQVLAKGIKPMGFPGDSYENDCNLNPYTGSGYGCSAKFLRE